MRVQNAWRGSALKCFAADGVCVHAASLLAQLERPGWHGLVHALRDDPQAVIRAAKTTVKMPVRTISGRRGTARTATILTVVPDQRSPGFSILHLQPQPP